MLDAMYKGRYFDADKKREMLHTQLDKMETDTVTVPPRKRGHRQTQVKLHCWTCMMKSWLRMKRLNKLTTKQHSK